MGACLSKSNAPPVTKRDLEDAFGKEKTNDTIYTTTTVQTESGGSGATRV